MTARTRGAADPGKPAPKTQVTEIMLRTRRALWLVLGMLSLSLLLIVLGVYTTTRTQSLDVSGYYSGMILTLGSFLGLLGLLLEENRKQLLTVAIVFLSFGIFASFLCLLVDGGLVYALDMRPMKAGRCQYYSSGGSYIYENFYASVSCWNLKESCTMTVRSGTCYCCDLYACANGDYLNNYYEFVGVQSCEEVFTIYIFIWILASLNLVAFFTGIFTTAVLGSIQGLWSSRRVTQQLDIIASSPTAPLLMDPNIHTAHSPHPGALMCFPPAERTAASQSPASQSPASQSPASQSPASFTR